MTSSSWYRRNIWQYKGAREYTRAGYETAQLRFGEGDLDVDCSRRHFIITGANSGLGLETAVEIARRGGVLHLVCRNVKSMKDARSHIITTTGNDRIYQHQVNLSKPKDVARWSQEFLKCHDRLDVLINNAGCLVDERMVDEDGNEMHFTVHILAVHIITTTLLPLLQKSENPRVVTVSSSGMLQVRLNPHDLSFEKLKPFDGTLSYSQTKRQQVVLNFCYAQRHVGIRFYSMHPGWVDTPGLRKSLPDFSEAMKDNLRTPLQGADTIIWLAISEAALKHSTGLFFQDRTPVATHLPLAWTRHTAAEEQEFMTSLDDLRDRYSTPGLVFVPNTLPESSTDEYNEHRNSCENETKQKANSCLQEITEEVGTESKEGGANEGRHDTEAGGEANTIVMKEGMERKDAENQSRLEKVEERMTTNMSNATVGKEVEIGDSSGQPLLNTDTPQLPQANEASSVLAVAMDESLSKMVRGDQQEFSNLSLHSDAPQNTPTSEYGDRENLSNSSQSKSEELLTKPEVVVMNSPHEENSTSKSTDDEGSSNLTQDLEDDKVHRDVAASVCELARETNPSGEKVDVLELKVENVPL